MILLCSEQSSLVRGDSRDLAPTRILKAADGFWKRRKTQNTKTRKHETRDLRDPKATISSLTSDFIGFVACSIATNSARQSVSIKSANDDLAW